ncbi:recombinase family protein [Gluconacetobacter sp. 1b LMG 1731]|uniref:Recombinase family protein n=2 Tax=Gluconacetobacter TaxID=89583 RepID=A0A7W4NRA9_9PROT|nr:MULTISPECIES: recombinase family protein [Gluconacetobacter]MBB2163409.1 recombinase family protein [Gluconacetobacter dulcium]MBB2192474.1 recombinase family protein [Gluconacetobacter dulcium]
MRIGYARTSTTEQAAGLAAQVRDLEAQGCNRVFAEQVSGTITVRPELEAAIDYLRQGDALVVTKPDRLARSTTDLLSFVHRVQAKGADLVILSMGGQPLDTSSPTSKLTLTLLAAVAEFERDIMKERQAEGIAKAKAEGKYRGRKPTARAKAVHVRAMSAEGVSPTEIAKRLGIGRASVYRCLEVA